MLKKIHNQTNKRNQPPKKHTEKPVHINSAYLTAGGGANQACLMFTAGA